MITLKAAFLICLITNFIVLFLSNVAFRHDYPFAGVLNVYQDEDGKHLFFETDMTIEEISKETSIRVAVRPEDLRPRT